MDRFFQVESDSGHESLLWLLLINGRQFGSKIVH